MLIPMPISLVPSEKIRMDLVESLERLAHIFMGVDYATSYSEMPLQSTTTVAIAQRVPPYLFRVWIPKEVVSNQGLASWESV